MVPVVWFTGLSGSGKSTISCAVEKELISRGLRVQVLDGDTIRTELSKDLGFSREHRCENLKRISFVAALLTRHDVITLVACISPYRNLRGLIRNQHAHFIEVYVNAPLAICEQRDPKGLYKKARAGILQSFTGISDIYELPVEPEVECRTDIETVEMSAGKVVRAIEIYL